MARLSAHRSSCQNPFSTGENEPAGSALIKGSDTYTLAPAISRAPTPAPPATLVFAPAAVNSTVKYSEADLQQILRTVLETRPPASTP